MEFNLAQVHEAVAAAVPDREAIVWRDRRLTYADVTDRTRRLANHLLAAGLQRSEEHTSELQSLMRNSYAVLCFKKKKTSQIQVTHQLLGTHKTKKYTSNNTYNTHQYRLV